MTEILFSCTIPGRPIVKKNSQRIVGINKKKRAIYSPQFARWQMTAILAVRAIAQDMKAPIDFPVNMKAVFYFENRQSEADLSALYEGIQDVLEKCQVLKNDKLIVSHDGSTKIFGEKPRLEVELTRK